MCHCIKHDKKLCIGRRSKAELTAICTLAGEFGTPTGQRHGLVPICRNESRTFETGVLNALSRNVEFPNTKLHENRNCTLRSSLEMQAGKERLSLQTTLTLSTAWQTLTFKPTNPTGRRVSTVGPNRRERRAGCGMRAGVLARIVTCAVLIRGVQTCQHVASADTVPAGFSVHPPTVSSCDKGSMQMKMTSTQCDV
jgi:hypothetical protein